jgi:hypothetical protein
MPIAQPARYITTAHSPLCSETMSLRGRGKDGSTSGEVLARHEPLGGAGHYEIPTEFQIEEIQVHVGDGSVGHDALLPARFPQCVMTSPGPSNRIRRVGRFRARLTVMKMLDNTEQSDRTPNPNEKPESCYCSALPKGSGPCLPCYTRWLAGRHS